MRRLIISLWILLACHLCISQCDNCERPIDVVVNGDFELGNTGFTSDLSFVPAPSILCTLCPEARYAVGPNAQEYHNNFSGLDHTQPGTGNFMICNGDSVPQLEVWCQTVNVSPATFYTFSFWASNITDNNEPHPFAQLQMRINGVPLPGIYEIDGAWQQISAQWYSGNNNQLSLCILNQQSSGGGNDFGIDDISFFTCQSIAPSEPAALGEDLIICGGETIAIGMAASANYTYEWIGLPNFYNPNIPNQLITLQNTTTESLQYEFILNADTGDVCNTADSINITVIPFEPIALPLDSSVCPNDSVQIILPVGYDEVQWSDGSQSANRYLRPGEYSLIVTDNGCVDEVNISISTPPNPQLGLGNDIAGCSNNPPLLQTNYSGIWSDGSASDSLWVYNSGQYSFFATINGCNYADTINIELFPVPSLHIGNDTNLCEGETLALSAGNAWDFTSWSTGSGVESIVVSQGGQYAVTAILANCIARDTIQISTIDSIQLELGEDRILCEGDAITLQTPAAGVWNESIISSELVVSSGGLYTFTYSPDQCPQSDTIVITLVDLPVLNLGNDTSICAGSSVEISVGNDWENLVWNDGQQQSSIVATAGIVSVTASISECSVTDQIILFPIVPIELNLGNDTTLCDGETMLLNAAATGLWNGTVVDDNYTVSQAGTYTFLYGNEGCIQSDEIIVTYDSSPEYYAQNDTTICRNTLIFLTAGNGWHEVYWNDSPTENSIIASAGTYYLNAIYGACTIADTIQIDEYNSPMVDLGADTILCEGDLMMIQTETPGLWNGIGPTDTYTIETGGEYIFEYSDGVCDFTDTVQIDFIELPPLLPMSDTSICPWDEFTLDLYPWPGTVVWANGSESLIEIMIEGSNSLTGQYNGCVINETFTLNHVPLEILPDISDTLVCSNPGLSLNFETPVQWSNGVVDHQILITVDGSYSYYLETLGCIQTDTFMVSIQLAEETGLPSKIALCGDEVTVQALIPGEWSDGQSGTTAIFQQTGSYQFHVVDSACNINYPFQIYLSTFPTITMDETVSFCEDETIQIEAEIEDALSYAWTDTSLGLTREIATPGVYTLVAQNECGSTTESIQAEVFPCNFGLYIPTAFTPNEDNINEGWRVLGFNLSEIDIKVYNRFGDLVFTSSDTDTYWNPGIDIGDDIYNYRITAKTFDGKALREYGCIYLLR